MKVYIHLPQPSRGLQRIVNALVRYAPVEVAQSKPEATHIIFFAIGRRDGLQSEISKLSSKQKYAVIQCCLRSTQKPSTWDWLEVWQHAEVIWSYYDLCRMHEEDGAGCGQFETQEQMDKSEDYDGAFYYAPLGVDPATFYPRPQPKRYVITTSGLSYLSESVRECWAAAKSVDRPVAHLGPIWREGVATITDVDDATVADTYSASEWVSGLRRTEGFELPAAEGLLCGARPLLFDTPDYRHWYSPWGVFLHEGSRDEVIHQLITHFAVGPKPVTNDEIREARERFDWKRIVGGFYGRLL